MPNGFESFAQNAMILGNRWREQRRERKLSKAMAGFESDPYGAARRVADVDAEAGYNMFRTLKTDEAAIAKDNEERQQKEAVRKAGALKEVVNFLRAATADPAVRGDPLKMASAYDSLNPIFVTALGMQPEEIAGYKEMFIKNPSMLDDLEKKADDIVVMSGGQTAFNKKTGQPVYTAPQADEVKTVPNASGGQDIVTVPRTYGGQPGVGGVMSGAKNTTPEQGWSFTGPHEGGFSPSDANGAPVNFGVNQSSYRPLPGFPANVKDLTREQAQQYYNERYFQPSGAAGMAPQLGIPHADTYYINPQRASEFMAQSGGDPNKYMDLREAWQARLLAKNPKKYERFRQAWATRNADLRRTIAGGVTPGQPTPFYSSTGKPAGRTRQLSEAEIKQRKLDPSYQWQEDKDGNIKIIGPVQKGPGGKQLSSGDKQLRFETLMSDIQDMRDAVTALKTHKGLKRAVGFESYFPSIRGGRAASFEANLDNLKNKVGLNALQQMREMSKTGGALGQVSNYENKILQNSIASVELSQSDEQFVENLDKLTKYVDNLLAKYQRAYALDSGGGSYALRGQQPKDSGGLDPKAVQMLKQDPSPQAQREFDEIFGAGAAKRALGR